MELRDKLFTEEQYVKQLAKYTTKIEKLENEIRQSEANRYEQINPNFYGRLLDYRVNSIITMYSMGEKLECIKPDYILAIKYLEKCWTPYGHYLQMLWLLSIGIMLDYDDEILYHLCKLIENNGIKDHVYDILLNYRFPRQKEISKCVFDDIPYHAILDVTSLAEQDKNLAVKRLKKYLTKEWYRGHSDYAWHNDHKYGIVHDGYWSFESGALVKVLGLDDDILKGQPYYPYDMVHWADGQK